MSGVIAWLGYVGAWLLVAGPVWQAAIELHEESVTRERFEELGNKVPQQHPSPWWWLLPPVGYLLQRRASRRYRDALLAELTREELESLLNYLNKAAGWFLVALGGTCIALKETWELHEHFEWPQYSFWLLVLLAAGLSLANLVLRIARGRSVLIGAGPDGLDRPTGRSVGSRAMAELPGVDLAALTRWLDEERPGLRTGELTGEVIAGGKSNLTYRISDGASTWALRRPPLAHVLPTAHDMAREYTVISALVPTSVPVPATVALCTDQDVLGANFYVMSFVDGIVLDRPKAIANLTPEAARRTCDQLIDTLVALHAVDPAEVGLAEFGRPDGFLARQVKRWHGQWQANETEHRTDLASLVEKLAASVPEQSAPGIVHGDYRLTNVMYRPDLSGIAAVVDWEMATLGDPLTDVGLLVVYQTLSAEDDFVMPRMSPGDGFPTADELVARYDAASGRDLGNLPWYVAFGYFKLAVIAEGIHHRYLQGKTVGEGFDHFGPAVPRLLATALRTLDA